MRESGSRGEIKLRRPGKVGSPGYWRGHESKGLRKSGSAHQISTSVIHDRRIGRLWICAGPNSFRQDSEELGSQQNGSAVVCGLKERGRVFSSIQELSHK